MNFTEMETDLQSKTHTHTHRDRQSKTHTHTCSNRRVFVFQFDCCGVGGPIEMFVRDTCPKGSFLQQLSYSSCPNVIKDVFNSNAQLVLGGFLGTAGIMTLALVCSCVLRRHVSVSRASPPAYVLLTSPPSVAKMI
uniref:Uncharacterized protein n=1 Tax=Sinocyclocheilus grahami TaxID=75366 RepID=A0A672P0P5_SINGR